MKKVGKGAIVLVVLLAGYLLLGLLAWLVPDRPVRHHIEQTLASGDMGEDYPKAIMHDDYGLYPYTMDD